MCRLQFLKRNGAAKFIAPSPVSDEEANGMFVAVEADANRARCDPNNVAAMSIRSNVGITRHYTLPDIEIVIFWHKNPRLHIKEKSIRIW